MTIADAQGSSVEDDFDDVEQRKEMFAWFGGTIYCCQVLEHGVVNLISINEMIKGRVAGLEQIDNIFETNFSKTLGHLVNELKKLVPIRDGLREKLEEAVKKRNYLCHKYFRINDTRMLTRDGISSMIEELKVLTESMREIDAEIDDILFRIGSKYGITREVVAKEFDRLIASAEGRQQEN